MQIENNYFTCLSKQTNGLEGKFVVELLPECGVYRGHFPGQPVSPGVFNIEMVKECAAQLIGRQLTVASIRQCRFMAVASPTLSPRMQISILAQATGAGYRVLATLKDEQKTYLELKADMHP